VTNPLRLLNKRVIGNVNVIRKRRHDFVMDRAWDYLDYVCAQEPENVIITGDFASTSTPFEFEQGVKFIEQLEAAGKKVTVIPGNHDVYTFESARKKEFGMRFFKWLPDEPPPCIQTLPGGTKIVYVPTVCPNLISSKGRISDFEIETTVSMLETCESPVVVAAHYPILNKTDGYDIGSNRQLRNAIGLRKALGESGKDLLYLCGHVHRFSDEIDPRYPNIRHVTTGAFFRTAPESNSDGDFSVVSVGESGFDVTRHIHQDGKWASSD
jgi:3',5'-cyclic AMP phosphodiesterase CpdA